MTESIRETCQTAIRELLAAAKLHRGDIVVIGCSSSEVLGEKIGTHSSYEPPRRSMLPLPLSLRRRDFGWLHSAVNTSTGR